MPAAAAMVRAIQYSLESHTHLENINSSTNSIRDINHHPQVIGKPNPYVVDLIMREHNITDKER